MNRWIIGLSMLVTVAQAQGAITLNDGETSFVRSYVNVYGTGLDTDLTYPAAIPESGLTRSDLSASYAEVSHDFTEVGDQTTFHFDVDLQREGGSTIESWSPLQVGILVHG